MHTSIETITPAIAAQMLKRNTHNRALRAALVDMYAREMKNLQWRETHQGIAINCDGTLLDGQHRLAAIVQSGRAQKMVVARGVPSASQIVMDDHAKRSAADAITLDGGAIVDAMTVAIARGVVRYASGDSSPMSRQEIASIVVLLRRPVQFIAPFIATRQRGVTAACVWTAVVLAWFYARDLDRLSAFCRILAGKELPEGDSDKAAVMLREWLFKTGASPSVHHDAFRKTQRAIVAFMDRLAIGKLYGTTVHFPWPLVDPLRDGRVFLEPSLTLRGQ